MNTITCMFDCRRAFQTTDQNYISTSGNTKVVSQSVFLFRLFPPRLYPQAQCLLLLPPISHLFGFHANVLFVPIISQ